MSGALRQIWGPYSFGDFAGIRNAIGYTGFYNRSHDAWFVFRWRGQRDWDARTNERVRGAV